MPAPPKRALGQPEFAKVPSYRWINNVGDAILAAIFVILIAAPSLRFFRTPRIPDLSQENRTFAPAPKFATNPLEHLPSEIDAYFGDYFGFRSLLVTWDSVLRYKWLGISSKRLVIGRDLWAFFTGDKTFENHMGLDPFQPSELEAWREYLELHHSLAKAKGSRYIFVVAPDKISVYPEMLPFSMRIAPGHSRLDQLIAYMKSSGSPVEIVDLREPMRAAKSAGLLYFPQDTHWNGRGYFVGYQAICNWLKPFLPGIQPQVLGRDYKVVPESWGVGDWAQVGLASENLKFTSDFLFPVGRQSVHRAPLDPIPELATVTDPDHMAIRLLNASAPYRLVMFHDSFQYTGIPERWQTPFAETFGESVYVGVYPTDAQFSSVLERGRPDVVIEERCERLIAGRPAR